MYRKRLNWGNNKGERTVSKGDLKYWGHRIWVGTFSLLYQQSVNEVLAHTRLFIESEWASIRLSIAKEIPQQERKLSPAESSSLRYLVHRMYIYPLIIFSPWEWICFKA